MGYSSSRTRILPKFVQKEGDSSGRGRAKSEGFSNRRIWNFEVFAHQPSTWRELSLLTSAFIIPCSIFCGSDTNGRLIQMAG